MWDEKYGGFYFVLLDKETNRDQIIKRAYGNAFAIFGLSAYYSLTKNEEAKKLAQETFYWMEKTYYDSLHGGYFDLATREGISFANKEENEPIDILENIEKAKYKDYNSTINILTAFIPLYEVWKSENLRIRLKDIFFVVRDTMINEKGHLNLYYKRDWDLISIKDSSKEYIMNNYKFDNVSFGSDIETAFLLLEAGEVLGLNNDKTLRKAKSLVDHTLKYGFDNNYAGIYYSGYYFKEDKKPIAIEKRKSWWCQAEGIRTLLLYSYIYPHKRKYKSSFYKLWHYVKKYLIDQKYGGWYPNGIDLKGYTKQAQKASKWKSCFHTYRALEYILKMLKYDKQIVK
jgi:mannobiose 2-epimerase